MERGSLLLLSRLEVCFQQSPARSGTGKLARAKVAASRCIASRAD